MKYKIVDPLTGQVYEFALLDEAMQKKAEMMNDFEDDYFHYMTYPRITEA